MAKKQHKNRFMTNRLEGNPQPMTQSMCLREQAVSENPILSS